jgi:hypothetical protein
LRLHARVHDRSVAGSESQCIDALLNSAEFGTRTCQEGAPAEVIDSRRILKVVEYLGGKTVQKTQAQDR